MRLFLLFLLINISAFAQVNIGTLEGYPTQSSVPIKSTAVSSYSQIIYLKSSINASGNISGITYNVPENATFNNSKQWEVYMVETDKNTFSSSSDYIDPNTFIKVYDGTIEVDNKKIDINFSNEFTYSGNKNLAIAVLEKQDGYGSYSDLFYCSDVATNTSITRYNYTGFVDLSKIDSYSKSSSSFLPIITLKGIQISSDAPPSCSQLLSPENQSTDVSFLPKLRYSIVPNADKYIISVGTTANGTDIIDNYDNGKSNVFYMPLELQPMKTYHISIKTVNSNGSSSGCNSYSFTTGQRVANDDCSSAVEVTTLPFEAQQDAEYSTSYNGPISCSGINANDGVWYKLKGTGADIKIVVDPIEYWNVAITVFKNSCSQPVCVSAIDAGSFGANEILTLSNTETGTDYFINIGHSSSLNLPEGTFKITFSEKSLGIDDAKLLDPSLVVFPNPVERSLNIKSSKNYTSYSIISIEGKKVASNQLDDDKINTNYLEKGVYILSLEDKSRLSVKTTFIKK